MYLTQTNIIRHLGKEEYFKLKEMCKYANNLYNVALYHIRQYYFQEKKSLSYEENYKLCKENENYKMLQAGVSQQILKVADRSFKSFFHLIKKAKKGEYRFQDIKMPHYREKGGMFPLILSTNAIFIENGRMNIPMSNAFMKKYGKERFKIPVRITEKIKEVRILPYGNGKFFQIQFCYEIEKEEFKLNKDNCLAIDIGLSNLAACVTNQGTSFLVDGRKLKSINQYWNTRRQKLQSIKDKQNIKGNTDKIFRITQKRNRRVHDYIKKAARYIVNYCIENNIGTIVCGYNPDFKRNIHLGKATNRHFTQISFGAFREQLENLCERYGMDYREQEESYTSKASFLDLDEIPVYCPNSDTKYTFSGKRVKRGLYQSKNGTFINADINGALNILRKSKQNFDFRELCKGLMASPLRIRLS